MESRLQLGDMGVFRCEPSGPPKAGLVLLQEIFGVNAHIREVARRWAGFGYDVAAPSLFDPVERDFEIGYTREEAARAYPIIEKLTWEGALREVQATIDFLRAENDRVHVMGYCYGGSLAFLAATRLHGLDKAVSYYGRKIAVSPDDRAEKAHVPVVFHFGRHDAHIPMEDVEKLRAAQAPAPVYVYDAGHGFNCSHRADYDEASARLAEQRTLAFFEDV